MMSPAFFEPIFDPFITLASFIFQSSQIASRTNKGLKYQAKTKPVDEGNFTIANLLGTEDCGFVVCDICRGSWSPFQGVLKNEAKQHKTKVGHSSSRSSRHNSHNFHRDPIAVASYRLMAIKIKMDQFFLFSNRRGSQEDDKADVIGEES